MFPQNDNSFYLFNSNSNDLFLPSLPFFYYESALEDDRHLFLQQHHDLLYQPCHERESFESQPQQKPLKKRASNRDRHSKINTARGLRDRRMRLSLDVARSFFGLQDMLGYDKASKTVEWLLLQSKHEIDKLQKATMPDSSSASASASECTTEVEAASGLCYEGVNKQKKQPKVKMRKSSVPLARDLRDKARARARERTIEKNINRNLLNQSNNQSLTTDQFMQFQNQDTSPPAVVDDSFINMDKWSPIFNSQEVSIYLSTYTYNSFHCTIIYN